MNREAFLARVRAAAESGRRFPVSVQPGLERRQGYADVGPNLAERYVAEMTAVGGRGVVVPSMVAAREELAKLMRSYEPRSALCWKHPTLDRLGLTDFLATRRIERIDFDEVQLLSADAQRAKFLAADIGITGASAVVAETGSLVMAHGPHHERLASLVPPVHVAIVERAQLAADLFDVFEKLPALADPAALPSNVTFITGPSKTGDIEMKLVTGVHGPGKFHVIVLDG